MTKISSQTVLILGGGIGGMVKHLQLLTQSLEKLAAEIQWADLMDMVDAS